MRSSRTILLAVLFLLFASRSYGQYQYDTLKVFPDTTSFYDAPLILVGDPQLRGIQYSAKAGWNDYEICGFRFIGSNYNQQAGQQTSYQIFDTDYHCDSLLGEGSFTGQPTFPEWYSVQLTQPIRIQHNRPFFLLSGVLFHGPFSYRNSGIMTGQFSWAESRNSWGRFDGEYWPVQIIIRRSLSGLPAINQPAGYVLANYPNPANPATTIYFSVPQTQHVLLQVYNQIGQKIAVLANSVYQAGEHTVQFQARHLPSGIYFYEIQAGKFHQVKKMVILK